MKFAAALAPLMLVFVAASAAAPAGAQTSTGPVSAVAASTEAFAWRSTAPLTVEAVLAHFERYDEKLRTLEARFTQTLSLSERGVNSVVEGAVAYAKPDRLRIEHARPERQTVVSDGDKVWIHRHSLGQVLQSSLADWKDSDPLVNNLLRFGDYGRMLKEYSVRLDSTGRRPALELRPKDKGQADFLLRLTLDPATLFPEQTELLVGSLRVLTTLERVRFNPPLAPETFSFTPPAGAELFRNFKPPRFQP